MGAINRGITPPQRTIGVERDPVLAREALGRPGSPCAAVADALTGLRSPTHTGEFDLVVANPPYGTGAAGLREMSDPSAEHIASAYGLWALAGGVAKRRAAALDRLRSYPAEALFLELCLSLARDGGHVAIILPEGICANARYAKVREWLLNRVRIDAVVGLPKNTFRRTGAAAKTVLMVMTKRRPSPSHQVLLGEVTDWNEPRAGGRLPTHFTARRKQSTPELLRRLDPTYYHPIYDEVLDSCRVPLEPLAEHIRELTYGPIVTGEKPRPAEPGIALVNQGQVQFCGVDLAGAQQVAEESPWVAERAMLRPGDVVLPRSGEGSLGKHRVAVFLNDRPASVGSFVDLIRLDGLNPFFLAAFLKSKLGRTQVSRVANGVGVPNISFDEIRGLQVPKLSKERQTAVEEEYRANVLPHHRRAVARHAKLRKAGADPKRDAALRRHREAGEREWKRVIERMDAVVSG